MGGLRHAWRTTFIVISAFLLTFTSLFTNAAPMLAQAGASSDHELTIVYTNDIHARIDGYGKASAYIKAEREKAEHFLYLDAGDIFSGNPVVDLNHGKPIVELLNVAGLDAMVIGNHEFDYGQDAFAERVNDSNFPWLSANMKVVDPSIPIEQPDPYQLFDVDGIKVAVFALTEAPPSTAPAGIVGLEFERDYAAVAKRYEDELKEQADVIIALTHIGYGADRALAEQVDYFDLIIGGHSHTTLTSPQYVNGTPIVQSGANLTNVGKVVLELDEQTNEVVSVEGSLQAVSELTEVDDEAQAIIDHYNSEMDELLGEVIGVSDTGLSRDGRYEADAPLGNFWTDAMRIYAQADVAVTNNGGIRDSIAPGEVTVGDIYRIEPFANEIMLFEMTGKAIKDVLAYSYSRGDRNQIDLQISGLSYEIIAGPVGNFIDVRVTVDGEPIDEEATYRVAVPDYIGTGGSGYEFDGEILEPYVGLMTNAMIDYAKERTAAGEKLNYSSEGRIKVTIDPSGPMPGDVIGSTTNGLYSHNKNKVDVGIGNLYTDAIREISEADLALLNGSSVTGEIPPGNITDKQIEALDRFGNEIVVVRATGEKIKEVILSQSSHHQRVDLQAAGLTYTLIPNGQGNGFQDVEIVLEDGTPLDPSKEYVVAYNDYMHGTGFYQLSDQVVDDGLGTVWAAVVTYIKGQSDPIDYVEGERIRIEGATPPDDPKGTITVAEAIAHNQGEATVRGYIVGSINGSPVIGEGNHAPSNLLLADSPDETDRTKMLPVQLPSGSTVRTGLNLVSHPGNLGEFVMITGALDTYFSTPGMRNPTAFTFADPSDYPDPGDGDSQEVISIAEARALERGERVVVEGVVTSTPGAWGAKGFYVQDETGGLYVYQFDVEVNVGDIVQVAGTMDEFNGELQLSTPSSINIVGSRDVPKPLPVTPEAVSLENEGQLVQLDGVTIENLRQVNNFGTFEFEAVRGSERVLIRVDNRTGLVYDEFTFTEGEVVTITGVSSQFRGTPQVKPRQADDIVVFEQESSEYLSVAEAIELDREVVKVKGYIVGNARNKNHVAVQSGAYNDHNVLIADDPNETDVKKMLLVQLKGTDRTAFGLVSNPEHYGKQVELTGKRHKEKFHFPLIKHPDEFVVLDLKK
ncbi:5'-nucleotidase C-terminal domain-containing protein [Halalkalibacterium halodurans]|jgi:2',3'-cyclic-nucleotide 2'-phosphodiesterase (5'-nucleotidase family)/DNA/RNA endonuclease YhcR with UshA esterase domain|uniref:5'-nucleotidase n=1 Tax=Halalkalibacterium halodurans TaxID=86665 RepID=A0A0M0KM89_ALKHA|nr:5'-nucleotidase C-terminal domain-containing protein [Halalkalibacterium halodurans]TPE70618.1 multifunctional 2',3'-cyclic-nucleotide 2'-phosphodiesterase/5'-nucleotidase/3'-nucleotidase [Halalkalibacterium halodurans]